MKNYIIFYPEADIDFLVRKGNEGLIKRSSFYKKCIRSGTKKKINSKTCLDLLKQIRRTKYDQVINLQRFASTGLLTGFSNAKERIGFDKNPLSFLFTKKVSHRFEKGVHEVERNNRLIEDFTDKSFNKPRLYPSQKDEQEIFTIHSIEPYVCMMPASVWFTKQYPQEKWIELINHFPA